LAEADRIQHDPEGVVLALKVVVWRDENKEENAFLGAPR